MAGKWEVKLVKPLETLRIHANDAWTRSMPELDKWMRAELIPSLVYGGNGIAGIAQTDFYRFITSERGLSELGIPASEPPKLLNAYATDAFKVRIHKSHMVLEFGNYVKLKAATPHPANGTGHLHIESWLEWVDGLEVGRGFVPRENIHGRATRAIRLGDPLGGLMLPRGAYGSTGLWRFPAQLRDYETKWFNQNFQRIEQTITDKMLEIFITKLIS